MLTSHTGVPGFNPLLWFLNLAPCWCGPQEQGEWLQELGPRLNYWFLASEIHSASLGWVNLWMGNSACLSNNKSMNNLNTKIFSKRQSFLPALVAGAAGTAQALPGKLLLSSTVWIYFSLQEAGSGPSVPRRVFTVSLIVYSFPTSAFRGGSKVCQED